MFALIWMVQIIGDKGPLAYKEIPRISWEMAFVEGA